MFAKKDSRAVCAHEKTVTVRTAGIMRTVCERCGKVSFQPLEGLSGRVDRSQFEREAERPHNAVL